MSKIITITFNPAIDKSTETDKIIPEKKLRCVHPKYEAGGGGINVSKALQHLGSESMAMYFAGGFNGNFFEQLLSNENVESIIVPVKTHIRTNIIIVEQSTGFQYRFGMEGQTIEENEWKLLLLQLQQQANADFIVSSGSLPHGVPTNIFNEVAKISKEKKAKLVVDTSGDALKEVLREGVFLIKPNLNELSNFYGKEMLEEQEVITAAKSIIDKGGCEVVVVSLGKEGAILVTKEECHKIVPPQITVKSTVGAGDSMVAGIVLAITKKMSWKDVLRYGVACGTSATMHAGTSLCRAEDVTEIFGQLQLQ
jgi:6-phosphofructokinase 2